MRSNSVPSDFVNSVALTFTPIDRQRRDLRERGEHLRGFSGRFQLHVSESS